MFKILAVLATFFLVASAAHAQNVGVSAGVSGYVGLGAVPGVGNGQWYGQRVAPAPQNRLHTRRGACPPGTTSAGQFGCVGATITDRNVLKSFDQHIARGCVPGQTRVIWRQATDPQGRPYRLKLTQHTECH
jgi:hypothetical protein